MRYGGGIGIPVQSCTINGKPGYKYGMRGYCYTYQPGSEASRKAAKRKAYLQGAAIEARTGENELKKAMPTIVFAQLRDGIAGYSVDGQRIYLDPYIPDYMIPCILVHEMTELPLVIEQGMPYPEADKIATEAERLCCINMGYDWEAYDAEFHRLMDTRDKSVLDPMDIHEGYKEDYAANVEKFNQNHDDHGRFSDSPGGGGGYKGPKQDVKGARLALKPYVGKKVELHCTVDAHGRVKGTNIPTTCINKINVKTADGKQFTLDHTWLRDPDAEIQNAAPGTKYNAVGTVTRYPKQGGYDYSVQKLESIVRKSVEEDVEKFNPNHDEKGKFAESDSSGGGAPLQERTLSNGLTVPEANALNAYQGAEYAFINSYMRYPTGGNKQDKEMYLQKAALIEQAIDKQEPLKGEEIVYRGIRADGELKDELQVGAVIEDPGFMSTSISRDVATNFGGTILSIRVPAGTRVLKMYDMIHNTSTASEKEILLQRGTKLEITHRREEKSGFLGMKSKTYLDARVVK